MESTDPRDYRKPKRSCSCSNWIQFVGQISVTIAIAIYAIVESNRDQFIAESNRQQELWIANETRSKDYSIAQSNRLHDLFLADDQQKDDLFNNYQTFLSDLLIKYGLLFNDSAVRYSIRYKTLTVLKQLDPMRRTFLIESLIEMKLMTYVDSHRSPIIDLHTGNLTGIDLSGKDIIGANRCCLLFDGTILNQASFHRTQLYGSSFVNTKLNHVDFSLSNNIEFDEQCWKQTNDRTFVTAFSNSQMSQTNFSKTEFDRVDFSFANMIEADLSEAKLTGTVFFTGTNLNGALLYGMRIESQFASFGLAKMIGIDGRHAMFQETTFRGAILINCSLNHAQIHRSSFANADLTNCQLNHAQLVDVEFTKTRLVNVDMSHIVCLANCSFDLADVTGVILKNATIMNSNLTGATFTEEQLGQTRSLAGTILPNGTQISSMK